MTPSQWEKLKSVFARLEDVPPAERAARAAEWSEGDAVVLAELEKMLAATSETREFLEPPSNAIPIVPIASPLEQVIPDKLGDYELIRRIGAGGMGYVYLARQVSLAREVALKLLPSRPGLTQREIERFIREARAVAALDHDRIVKIYDVTSVQGIHIYAMDYIAGHDLGTEITLLKQERDHVVLDEPHLLPRFKHRDYLPTVVRIMADVADAIEHAHEKGITHRDIKPQNILLDEELKCFIVDFGLAKDDRQSQITMSGDIVGSPAYMSPEQVIGRHGRIDKRTDVYSLGVVLYELITLKRPFDGRTSREVLNSVLEEAAIPVRRINPRVPVDLETICMKALSREPADRYQSAEAFARDCNHFLEHEAIEAVPPTTLHRTRMFVRRHRAGTIVTACALLLATLATFWIRERIRSTDVDAQVERLRELIDRPEVFVKRDPEALGSIVHLYTTLDRQREGLTPEQTALLDETRTGMDGVVDRLIEEGLAAADEAMNHEDLAEAAKALTRAVSSMQDASWISRAGARSIGPLAEELVRPAVSAIARDVDGAPLPATLYARKLIWETGDFGPSEKIGSLPIQARRFDTGFYRLTIVFDRGGFRDFSRWLDPLKHIRIEAAARDDEPMIKRDMIAFSQSEVECSDRWDCPLRARRAPVEAFYLDACEVSNADYREFCEATGKTFPVHFSIVSDFSRIADLPVNFLEYANMLAYAEWRGKRLPTHLEIERATRGPVGHTRTFAWGEANPEMVGASIGKVAPDFLDGNSDSEDFVVALEPARSCETAMSPEGVYHLTGNVAETTETPAAIFDYPRARGVEPKPLRFDRRMVILLGETFSSKLDEDRGLPHAQNDIDQVATVQQHIGFRCAKSAEPIVNDLSVSR